MNSFTESLRAVLRGLAIVVGWTLLALCVFIVVSALLRKFFDIAIQGANEYGGYILAVSMGFGFAYAILDRAHIRITILRDMFGDGIRAALDVFAMIVLTIFAANIAYSAYSVLSASWRMNAHATTALQTPLAVPQALWTLSLLFFAVTCAVLALGGIVACLRKNWAFVERFLGTRSTDEDIKEELRVIPAIESPTQR